MIAWQAGRAAVDRLAARGVLQRLAGTGADVRIAEMPDGIAHYVSLVSHYVSLLSPNEPAGASKFEQRDDDTSRTFLIWQA